MGTRKRESVKPPTVDVAPQPGAKPIDRWLTLATLVIGVIIVLVPRTPEVVASLLVLCYLLLIHPVWNFWWVERSLARRLSGLFLLAVLLSAVGHIATPGSRPFGDLVRRWFGIGPPIMTAQVITCSAATQEGLTAGVVTGSTSCALPTGAEISGAVLDYTLDDGGEVYINGKLGFALAPDVGIDTGTVVLPVDLFLAGDSVHIQVTARNAVGTDGAVAHVFGRATVHVSTQSPRRSH